MPINTDLNISPYFDDFDLEKQFYKILFKPAYAVQARELTQLQTILQNQVEQFGDNVYKEGSIIKGCNFTELSDLKFVKVNNPDNFDIQTYRPSQEVADDLAGDPTVDVVYEIEGQTNGLTANIIWSERGFETRPPNLNTFFISYNNAVDTNTNTPIKTFIAGEVLTITKKRYNGSVLVDTTVLTNVTGLSVTNKPTPVGQSFGLQSASGVIFQKGHFLFADEQTLIISKYDNNPDGVSVGFEVEESIIRPEQDNTLYDNASGSTNENAPGADRLKLVPKLVTKTTSSADLDATFFTLVRYKNGNAVTIRDVSQFNALGDELARRTYEESGNYIVDRMDVVVDKRGDDLKAIIGKGSAYVKGFRIDHRGDQELTIDQIANTVVHENQSISINYGGYVNITDLSGTVDLGMNTMQLQNSAGTPIGSAYARNITENRLYLSNIKMTNSNFTFKDVDRINGDSGTIFIANNSILQDVKNAPFIFDTGQFSLKSITDMTIPARESVAVAGITGNSFTLSDSDIQADDFSPDQADLTFVDAGNDKINILSFSRSVNLNEITVNLDPADNSDPAGTLYVNTRYTANPRPFGKLVRNVYVKNTYSAVVNTYSLGFPDVYEILEVTDNTGTDYSESFRLRINQKDTFYDISYMEYIPGRPKPNAGTITVRMKCFEPNPASGKYFFTIDSYPIDDETAVLPNDKCRSWQIPTYSSGNKKIYNMRECIDFRPHADKNAAVQYSHTTPASAGTITQTVGQQAPQFSRTDYLQPCLNAVATGDIETYLARVDSIIVDSFGSIKIVKGVESATPVPPQVGADEMVISQITIPGYPALSPNEAANQRKFEYAVSAKSKGTPRYRMRDIEKIEKRLEGLEYYISLSQLESSVENMTILDENGLTRFKNGYLVDPMNDSSLANLEDTDYKAAIHFNRKILTPAVKTFPMDLKYKTSTNATIFPNTADADVATLERNAHVELLNQPYATNFRNCVSNFWSFNGTAELFPSHDMVHDTVTNPTRLNIDLATPFTSFVEGLQRYIPLTDTQWGDVIGSTQIGNPNDWFPTPIQEGTVSTIAARENATIDQRVGDFVSNVQFMPFIRARDVNIFVSGLRPNTKHYFFFDGVDVNQDVAPGTAVNATRDIQAFGDKGADVLTDENGVLRAVFSIPEETFFVGERVLYIVDVDQYSSIASGSTSRATIAYNSYNISIDAQSMTASTRTAEFFHNETTTTRNLPRRRRPRPDPPADPPGNGNGDPLAQTFFIKKGMGEGSNSVFVSKIDLYFKRKSETNGITVMLREVENGYPTNTILPFGKVHLLASEINVSDTSDLVTTVTFPAPVRMDIEKEYCVVLMPDANDPNYLHFTSKVGGNDLTSGSTNGQAVVQDWGDGVLFTSTNNRAWSAYQDEDLKFKLHRHDFNASVGSVTMTNDDHEFFTLSDWDGKFVQDEYVYQIKPKQGATVSGMTISGTTVTADSGVLGDTYAADDYVLMEDSGNVAKDIFRVVSVNSNTEMTVDKPAHFTVASGEPIVVGRVSYYDKLDRTELHLKGSSARTSRGFAAGTIEGLASGVQATIATIDDINLSYIQPIVMKANDSITRTQLKGTFVPPANTSTTYQLPMRFGDNNTFTQGVTLFSKSNDPSRSKAFDITVEMSNGSNSTSTPMVDMDLSAALAYQYMTASTAADTSKYISKRIELAEDLDAEDMEIFVTGYRPPNTDIKVYIRPQNTYDAADFDTLPWIELELVEGVGVYCSAINQKDYREYKYKVAAANKDADGVLEYTSTEGDFSGYRKFAIRIDLIADDLHQVPMVKDYRGIALT